MDDPAEIKGRKVQCTRDFVAVDAVLSQVQLRLTIYLKWT